MSKDLYQVALSHVEIFQSDNNKHDTIYLYSIFGTKHIPWL